MLRAHAVENTLHKHEIPWRGAAAISAIREQRSIFEGGNTSFIIETVVRAWRSIGDYGLSIDQRRVRER